MPRHTVTFEEMSTYVNRESWAMAACSSSHDSHKRLESSTKGMFRVTDRDRVIYQGASLGFAVDAYNDAP